MDCPNATDGTAPATPESGGPHCAPTPGGGLTKPIWLQPLPSLTLEADRAEDTPLALLCPPALSQPLYVEVRCGNYANLEAAFTTLFSCLVVDVEATGRRLRPRCATWLDVRGTVCQRRNESGVRQAV